MHTTTTKMSKLKTTKMEMETHHGSELNERKKGKMAHRQNTRYCYKSFCLLRRSLESPIFFRLSLARELVGMLSSVEPRGEVSWQTCRDSSEMSSDRFLPAELKATEESSVERLIAESANDDGTVTERLLVKSKLRR